MGSKSTFIVVGADSGRGLMLQVLIALHAFTPARCVAVCSGSGQALRYSSLCNAYMDASTDGPDDSRFVAMANHLVKTGYDPVIVPADCDSARMVSRVRQRLLAKVIPAPDAGMLDCLNNKWQFYQLCRQHGLPVPETIFIGAKHNFDFTFSASVLGIPLVVKPVSEAGSQGVHIISSEDEYRHAIGDNENYLHEPLIVQRYVPGIDIGIDLLAVHGKVTALAMQRRSYPQHEAAKIDFFYDPRLEEVAHRLSEVSAYHGVMNIDARIEEGTGKVYLLESNPRFWRSLVASAWCGLNFAGESVACLSSQKQELQKLTNGSADTFYHPLFRPTLWPYGVFDRGAHGRIVRLMMSDPCLFAASTKALLTGSTARHFPAAEPHANAAPT